MQDQHPSFFSKARSVFWPIYGREHKLFLPLATMLSLILFAYTVCRGIKDTGVMSAQGNSSIISFLKVYGVVPFAILFFILFSWLSNKFARRSVFYIVVIPFLAYFLLHAFVIYPNDELLQPTAFIDNLIASIPEGAMRNWFSVFLGMFKFWPQSLFYIMSELWGSAVLSLLFWQFANDIVPIPNAKRFYAHFYLVGNFFVMLAGVLESVIGKAYKGPAYTTGLQIMVSIVIAAGAAAVCLYYYVNNVVLKDPAFQLTASTKAPKKSKAKMSIGEGFKFLFKSRYLGLIAILVICYGVSINLVEVLWKGLAQRLYPEKADLQAYMGDYHIYTGFFTILAILVGSSVLRRFGWLKTALATPLLMGISAFVFYVAAIWQNEIGMALGMASTTVLAATVMVGLIQNLLSKPTKYAMFDPTKEMAYIPLDDESKMKGKAAVDVVGARFGKSGGAAIGQILVALVSVDVLVYAPQSFLITMAFVALWLWAVPALGKRFKELTGEK